MAIIMGSHAEVVRNHRSKADRPSTSAQNIEEMTSTTSPVSDETTGASDERDEQNNSADGSAKESKQTSSDGHNSEESNILVDEGTEQPKEPTDLTSRTSATCRSSIRR